MNFLVTNYLLLQMTLTIIFLAIAKVVKLSIVAILMPLSQIFYTIDYLLPDIKNIGVQLV
ncbi:MAG: hypothetical protein ACXAC2_17675 [Candidatus Kariarchaeaceae archaeon]